jgi:hypothetical protein
MATNPLYTVSLSAFPQRWDGANIRVRILVMPQGNPLSPLLAGVSPTPSSPAFADGKPQFVAQLIPSLAALPAPAAVAAQVDLTTTPPTDARALFEQLATQFNIAPDAPGNPPRRNGFSISKYLPDTYRDAFNFDRPSTPFAVTDDRYFCMLKNPPIKTFQPPPPATVSWGRVMGYAIRQPLLSSALGLVYDTTFALPQPSFFANGGWLCVNFSASGDFAQQIAANPALMQAYAARIPPLTTSRQLFGAVLFPVLATPSGDYDDVFVEAQEYDDGFVKIVHSEQPTQSALLNPSGTLPPTADYGLQMGWDDEQVTTWFNRQVDASQIDAPFSVAGYCLDTRRHGSATWNSLCQVTGALSLGATSLGTFNGELGVEAIPLQLDPSQPTEWWLPSYFGHWRGGSAVLADPVALKLHGTANPSLGQQYTAVNPGAVPLLYGQSYDLRVRMMDLTRAGPNAGDSPINPGPAPIATIPFRRMQPFKTVSITNLNLSATPAAPQTTYLIDRPLLNYPGAVFAGIPNAVAELLADLPNAMAQGREAGLPDPDAVMLQVQVLLRQLANDAAIFVDGDVGEPYSPLYTTTRPFPTDATQALQLDVSFQDVPDIGAFPPQPASGPLVLPTARDIRLVFSAAAAPDPQLLYWGSAEAMQGITFEAPTGANAVNEKGIFVPNIAANQICGIMLQPDPVQTSNFAQMLAVIGQSGTTTSDCATLLAQQLSLNVTGLTYTAQAGVRTVFGCSAALRHSLSPEHGAITFSAKTELCGHWLIAITLELARDWSWSSLAPMSFEVKNGAGAVVGALDLTQSVSTGALADPDRSTTNLIFFDAVSPLPVNGAFPAELDLTYTMTPLFPAPPTTQDGPLRLAVTLPIAANPTQTPQLASAGIALSPYSAAPDYSSTTPRQRALWLEFAEPIADPDDTYFGRVLAYAPDQMLTGAPFAGPARVDPPPEPPLGISPELIRVVVPGQSDDEAGLAAMQPLLASNSPLHYALPLPSGLAIDAPELFGMFVYEFRVGHQMKWSTAQGRFGPPLRVAGVQQPPPPLLPAVSSMPETIAVSASYATPVFSGRNLLPLRPRTQLWALLYAQVTQADRSSQRNILLSRLALARDDKTQRVMTLASGMAGAVWERSQVEALLADLALSTDAPLSVLVVETLPDIGADTGELADPLGGDLGYVRILRTSPLTAIPALC